MLGVHGRYRGVLVQRTTERPNEMCRLTIDLPGYTRDDWRAVAVTGRRRWPRRECSGQNARSGRPE